MAGENPETKRIGRVSSEGTGWLFYRQGEVPSEVAVRPGVEMVVDDNGAVRGYRIPTKLVVEASTLERQ